MNLNYSKIVLVALIGFVLIKTAVALPGPKPTTTSATVNATGGTPGDRPDTDGKGRDKDDDGDGDDGKKDSRDKPIKIDTYNAFNFYGQGRAVELIRRMAQRLASRDGRGYEGGDSYRDGEGRDEKEEKKNLKRTNYEEFPDEARELPKDERRKFAYGEAPFSPNFRRRPQPVDFNNPFQGPDSWPVRPNWGGGQGGGFPTIPLSPLGILLLGPGGGGALPGLQPPHDCSDDEDKKGKKKKRRDRMRYDNGDDDSDDDDGDDGPPSDWTNLCIYECGEGVPNGYHRKCGDCSTYFMCVDGMQITKDCKNLKFNHQTDQCDVASAVDCDEVKFAGYPKTTSESSMTSQQSPTSQQPKPMEERLEDEGPFCVDDCYGVPDGTYPSCLSCRKFTKCYWGSAWSLSCHRNKFFDPQYEMCRPAHQVDCREEEIEDEEMSKNGKDKV